MSAVLHPTGPETPRTYWIRRAAVLAAVLLVVLVVLWAFRPADADVRAVPGPGPSTALDPGPVDPGPTGSPSPPVGAAPSDSPSPAATATDPTSRGSAESGEADAEDAGSDDAGSDDAGSDDADSGDADAAERDEAGPGATDSDEPDRDERERADGSGTADPEPEPVLCRGADVRVGLDGSSRPETGQPHELEVSLTNESADPCELVLDESTVELRVFSGTDRIWTTQHCPDWLAVAREDRRFTLDPDQTQAWTLDWPVQRSAEDCELLEQPLGEGTYVATALHRDSEPAQLVMVLG